MRNINSSIALLKNVLLLLILISCDKQVSVTSPDRPVPNTKIVVETVPAGSTIFLNNANTGKVTPDSIVHIEPGMYRIKLSLSPYIDIEDSVFIAEDSCVKVYKNYFEDSRNFGKIVCESEPAGASIFINDSSTGLITPAVLETIWPDTYKITCSLNEHRDHTKFIFVVGGETKSEFFSLQDTSVFVDYNSFNSTFPAVITNCVAVDDNNVKWIGNFLGGIVKFDKGNWTYLNTANSDLINNSITFIEIDNQNNKWIGTPTGVVIIDNNDNMTAMNQINGIPLDYIMAIEAEDNGVIWMASANLEDRNILWRYDGIEWTHFYHPPGRVIISLIVDDEGTLWAGLDQGFNILLDGEWESPKGNFLAANPRLRNYSVETFAKDKQGWIWIGLSTPGGYAGGLFYFDGINYKIFELPEKYISHLNIDENDNIWISCQGKYPTAFQFLNDDTPVFMKIDSEYNITTFTVNMNKIPSQWLKWSAMDQDGIIWIGSRDRGIIKFKVANL